MSVATCNHLCLRPFAKQKLYSFYVIKSLNHLLLATLWCKFILFAKNKLAIIHCIYKIKTKARKSTEAKGSVTLVTDHQLTLDNHNYYYVYNLHTFISMLCKFFKCFKNKILLQQLYKAYLASIHTSYIQCTYLLENSCVFHRIQSYQ